MQQWTGEMWEGIDIDIANRMWNCSVCYLSLAWSSLVIILFIFNYAGNKICQYNIVFLANDKTVNISKDWTKSLIFYLLGGDDIFNFYLFCTFCNCGNSCNITDCLRTTLKTFSSKFRFTGSLTLHWQCSASLWSVFWLLEYFWDSSEHMCKVVDFLI